MPMPLTMQSRHQKSGKGRKDRYYFLAKEAGFRSRAAFKISQLDKKFNFLSASRCLVDLCAAPGGWSQVAAKTMPVGSLIVAVDLVSIRAIPGVVTLQGDITTQQCRADLRESVKGWAVDTVVHDGAPNMGADWAADAYSQSWLVLAATKLACEFLRPGGTYVTKIFRSADYGALIYVLNQMFAMVDVTKPKSSRDTSAEVFAVCRGYKAPAVLDPALFDPKKVFEHVDAVDKHISLKQLTTIPGRKGRVRHRSGYAEGDTLYSALPVLSFIFSKYPVDLLAKHNLFIMGPARDDPRVKGDPQLAWKGRQVNDWDEHDRLSGEILEHASTTAEVINLCSDLKVLAKRDLKVLLAWRQKVQQHILDITEPDVVEHEEEDEEEASEILTAEQRAQADSSRLLAETRRKRRRALRKKRKAERKAAIRLAQSADGGMSADVINLEREAEGMFSISEAVAAKMAPDGLVATSRVNAAARRLAADAEESESSSSSEESELDLRDPESRLKYLNKMEQNMDGLYSRYVDRIAKREAASGEALMNKVIEDPDAEAVRAIEENAQTQSISVNDPKVLEQRWFAHPQFEEDQEDQSEDSLADAVPLPRDTLKKAALRKQRLRNIARKERKEGKKGIELVSLDRDVADSGARAPGDLVDGPTQQYRDMVAAGFGMGSGAAKTTASIPTREEAESEDSSEVSDSWGDDTEGVLLQKNPEDAAERMAIAANMVRKKSRRELIEASYNRWNFDDDPADLPSWFVEDERIHMRAQLPITKDEVDEMKRQLEEVNARPIKKVIEARARKRMRGIRRMEALQKKADAISKRSDLTEPEKVALLEKTAHKLKQRETRSTEVKKGKTMRGVGRSGHRRRVVDSRSRADGVGHAFAGGKGKKAMRKEGSTSFKRAAFREKNKGRRRK